MNVFENKTSYCIDELIGLAQRENNQKRNYLLVNYLQAKHVPVSPSKALCLFEQLEKELEQYCHKKTVTFIGFAETATAIGAAVASAYGGNSYYIQTTREDIDRQFLTVGFLEEHSHATEQMLYCKDSLSMLQKADKIIFVEDEITTGKTILNFITQLEKIGISCANNRFGAVSIINSMTQEQKNQFAQKGIGLFYLASIENQFDSMVFEGKEADTVVTEKMTIEMKLFGGRVEPRTGLNTQQYQKACQSLADNITKSYQEAVKNCKTILVLGSEECMYPAICTALQLENSFPGCSVVTHATTRSPILPSKKENSPLKNRTSLESMYQKNRKTFVYNLKQYDIVFFLTDAQNFNQQGADDLVSALKAYGNEKVIGIRWIKE